MIPVQDVLSNALAAILRKAPLTPEKVAFAWRSAVGPAVDKATAIDLRGGVLHVRASDAAWQREIERSAAVIRARLDTSLGPEVVRYIEVTAATAPAAAARSDSVTGAAAPARSTGRSEDGSGSGPRHR
jgi:predicted nucleic acid-binding Zn ribbon protein